jgi:hypothetical protein
MDSENVIKFEQMKRYFFDKETTTKFIQYLMKKATVIAPHLLIKKERYPFLLKK